MKQQNIKMFSLNVFPGKLRRKPSNCETGWGLARCAGRMPDCRRRISLHVFG
jgi:hypothetical protein